MSLKIIALKSRRTHVLRVVSLATCPWPPGELPFLVQCGCGLSLSSAMAVSVQGRFLWGRECPPCCCRPPWLSPRSCTWSPLRLRCITKASRLTLRWVLPQSWDGAVCGGDWRQEPLVGTLETVERWLSALHCVYFCLFFSQNLSVSHWK